MRQLFRELKRRNVYRVAVTYAAVAFVTLQAAQLVFPATTLEGLYDKLVVLAFVGFPIALVLAWAFEMTPEGVRRTPTEGTEALSSREKSRLAVKALAGLGLVGAAVAGGWYLVGGGGETGPRAGERSIAVLPFEALGQAEPDAFTEGMHDGLLARLSNVSGLKVISRTSVQQYRDTEKTTAEIARELGVRWVLEGGVQEMGDQIQVNAQLIDPRTDTHAWADTYRRDLTAADLFDLQSEITKKIVRSLETQLTQEESDRVERRPTEDLEAYRLYVQGRSRLDTRTETGMRQAVDHFRRAIERDSSYALAWSGLADARMLLLSYGHAPPDSLLAEALDAAERALELDPQLAEAHASLGLVRQNLRRDGPAALRAFHRAIELKPSYARAHHWLGLAEFALGRVDRGLSALDRAAELNPNSPPIHVARSWAYYLRGQSEEALESALRARELSPGYPLAHVAEGIARVGLEEFDAGLEALRRGLEMAPAGFGNYRVYRAWPVVVHARAGDTARARAYRADLEREGAGPLVRAVARAALGETDAAFAALREARWTSLNAALLRYDPVFDQLRDRPRYEELIRDLNRSWGLNPDGSLPDSVDVSFDLPEADG